MQSFIILKKRFKLKMEDLYNNTFSFVHPEALRFLDEAENKTCNNQIR